MHGSRSGDSPSAGTATLDDLNQGEQLGRESIGLKHSSGRNPVILIPQPSDDPNDPLVRLTSSASHMLLALTIRAELTALAPRPDSLDPVHALRHRINPLAFTGSQYTDVDIVLSPYIH